MTQPRGTTKPSKPYASFPLTPHPRGTWCKKIRGKLHHFGPWVEPQAALDRYLAQAAALHAGREPTVQLGHNSIKDLVNRYLSFQADRLDAGEIGPRWFEDCRRILTDFGKVIGVARPIGDLRPEDFQAYRVRIAKRLGVHAITRSITAIKAMFNYAVESGVIERLPTYGKGFSKPTAMQKRKSQHRAEQANGKNLFTVDQVRQILNVSEQLAGYLRPAVLLGINGGFGNTDCAELPLTAVDLDNAVIEFHRPKTGVRRTIPLWPETVQAIQLWLENRPKLDDPETNQLVFVTVRGLQLARQIVHRDAQGTITRIVHSDRLSDEFIELLTSLKLKRKRIGFYTLRHTFRTWADETRDHHAIFRLMCHTLPGMSSVYVEEIGMDRLRAVVDHVRAKIFGDAN